MQALARDCRLRVEPEVTFGVDADLARVLALLEALRLQDAVVCTHGEVIEQVLTRLVADGLTVGQPLEWPKGSSWPMLPSMAASQGRRDWHISTKGESEE
jgi:hypothetical protein